METRKIDIYTDGSCLGNPGPGGWAALILLGDKEQILSGGDRDTTNNRMEMTAITEALGWIKENFSPEELANLKIEIFSDSNLIIQTLNLGWKRKANTDIWAEMDKNRAWLNITWTWVKGHADNVYNNRVDLLAVKESKLMSRA